jgi:epoxyqueuosine reductase QueG
MFFGLRHLPGRLPLERTCPVTEDAAFAGSSIPLPTLAELSPEEFHQRFGHTPVARAKHAGLLRNVAIAYEQSRTD